jgi:BirA family biotin operon repressor/biotin-[acetyl-CoA-carboxylase] ligase
MRLQAYSKVKDFHLSKSAIAEDYRLSHFENIASTNSEALEFAKFSSAQNHWFVSDNQSAGRGRMGRAWISNKGNLAASLLLFPKTDQAKCATLSFVAAIAIFNALKEIDKDLPIYLKWPNDILIKTRDEQGLAKLVGILLEAQTRTDKQLVIALGFGINIVSSPKGLPYLGSSLYDIGIKTDAKILFEKLSKHWIDAYHVWNDANGVAQIMKLWKQGATGIGEQIFIKNTKHVISGIFEDIDETGRLMIKTPKGKIEYISSGDVHFGAAQSNKDKIL